MTQPAEMTAEKAVSAVGIAAEKQVAIPKWLKITIGVILAVVASVAINAYLQMYSTFQNAIYPLNVRFGIYLYPLFGIIFCAIYNRKRFHITAVKDFKISNVTGNKRFWLIMAIIWALPTIWLITPVLAIVPLLLEGIGLYNVPVLPAISFAGNEILAPLETFLAAFSSGFHPSNWQNYLIQAPAIVAGYALCKTFFVKK